MSKTIKYKSHKQMSEAFLTAAFLSLSGGLQDAYTYISRGEVFANAQTGNIVLLSKNIFEQNWLSAVRYLVPLLAFAFGVMAAEMIRQFYQNAESIHWRQLVVIIEIVLLIIVGFLPSRMNILANLLVSFSCAMQVQAFRKVNGYSFASTMCIGNIRSAMESLCAYRITRNRKTLHKTANYLGIILLFAVGAGLGSSLITVFGFHAIWFSCLSLFVSFLIMFIKEEKEERAEK